MPEIYDFTVDEIAQDKETRAAFFRLRRLALLASDPTMDPAGKTMTAAEVAAALGETQAAAVEKETSEVKPCC